MHPRLTCFPLFVWLFSLFAGFVSEEKKQKTTEKNACRNQVTAFYQYDHTVKFYRSRASLLKKRRKKSNKNKTREPDHCTNIMQTSQRTLPLAFKYFNWLCLSTMNFKVMELLRLLLVLSITRN